MTFSHDGLRDTLTHLAAPPYFYENLRRDLLSAERHKTRLSLVRFLLESGETFQSDSEYEVAILGFSELLTASTRAEDLCARLGRFEFTLILKTDDVIARALATRVVDSWDSSLMACRYSVLKVNPEESSLEILNRLDTQELL
jgi:GGDEF domain-containing protein